MKTRFFEKAIVAAALSFGAAYVMATPVTLDFDGADQGFYANPEYSERGFSIAGELLNWDLIGGGVFDLDPTGHALTTNFDQTTPQLRASNGSSFDFISIDLGDVRNGQFGDFSEDIKFDFVFSNASTTSQTVHIDSAPGTQTFIFNLQDVTLVTLTPEKHLFQFDNIRLDDRVGNTSPPVSGVPEPESLALLGAGLLGMFAARRRKS